MKKNCLFSCRILPIACLMLLPAAIGLCQKAYPLPGAEAGAPSAPADGTALPAPPLAPPVFGNFHWDYGVVDALHTDHVEHTFTLKNESQKPVSISHLRGSCGCETLFLSKNGADATTATLKPGENAQMRISVHLNSSQSGEMHKFAWAYGPDAVAPLASVEMVITVRPSVVFVPDVLDFGEVAAGKTKSLAMTVTADEAVLGGEPLPAYVCSNPAIVVAADGPETSASRDGKPSRTRRYHLTLTAPAASGSVSGQVQPAPGAPPLLAQSWATVMGVVAGGMTAQPRAVVFGSVPAGQGMTRQILLTIGGAGHGQPLTAASSSPFLTARITGASASPTLEVLLKKDAPVGALQASVTLHSSTGEQLSLPVVGSVVKD